MIRLLQEKGKRNVSGTGVNPCNSHHPDLGILVQIQMGSKIPIEIMAQRHGLLNAVIMDKGT